MASMHALVLPLSSTVYKTCQYIIDVAVIRAQVTTCLPINMKGANELPVLFRNNHNDHWQNYVVRNYANRYVLRPFRCDLLYMISDPSTLSPTSG